jgi:drug/metabolite transporter (DMT)-like permease
LFLPLASSLLYVVAALFLKQAATRGVGAWRTGFVCNWVTAGVFLLLWPLGGELPELSRFHQPALVGFLFVAAQMLTFVALQKGDVSVATPVLGSKVLLVALFTVALGAGGVTVPLWVAAGCSCLGIGFLHRSGGGAHRGVLRTIWLSLGAASCYAIFDVLIMAWAPDWGLGRFLPITMMFGAFFSLGFIPFFGGPLRQLGEGGGGPLALGALFISLQAVILVSAIGNFGEATAINVVYSLRGLWSVVAVWWLGHWFGNRERELGAGTLKTRLLGAAFLCVAVVLVLW